MTLQLGLGSCKSVAFVIVMFPDKAEHEEISGLAVSCKLSRLAIALGVVAPTLWIPQPMVARMQKTPVTIDPFEKADIVLMIPADPVLGMPMSLFE